MLSWLKKHQLSWIGLLLGGISGFLYWKYVGCLDGTCKITSRPVNSTIYGALIGFLLFNLFQGFKKK